MTEKVAKKTLDEATKSKFDDITLKVLEKADAVIFSMGDSYTREAQRLSLTIKTSIGACSNPSTDEFERQIFLEEAFQASHELRGQAGMFGYGLLTELCQSLCSLLEIEQTSGGNKDHGETIGSGDPDMNAANDLWASIQNHTTIVGSIVNNDIKGDGGKLGMALKSEVNRLRRHAVKIAA